MQAPLHYYPLKYLILTFGCRLTGTSLNNSDFKVYLDYSNFRLDPKHRDNLELRDGNPYPTLPMMEKPQAPYMETP